MQNFHTILHPTDFSEISKPAAEIALSLARDHQARLILLTVAHVEVVYGTIPVTLDMTSYRDSLDAMAARLAGSTLEGRVETLVRQGSPATEILRAAEEFGCDLIVLGTHGRSGMRRALLGSVAEAVLRHATCPVLIAKASIPEPGSHPS